MPRLLRTINAPSQQLNNFTNRQSEQEVLKRLLDLPEGAPLPVVVFWGVGGNGKSWLLRKLREALPPGFPSTLLDLDPMSGGTPYHTDSSRALAELRQQMHQVAFPRFDLAYAWLRYKEGVKDEPLLRGSGAAAKVFELVSEFAPKVVEGVPYLGWLLKHGAQRARQLIKDTKVEQWLAKQVGQEDFQKLRRMTPQELYAELPDRFLLDAAEHLPPHDGRAVRGIVLIDTFEALQQAGVMGQAQCHDREAWVRGLHAADSPLLLVLAGRDRVRWDRFDPGYADQPCLEQHLVGGLSRGDARAFLEKCGISDPALQSAALRVAVDSAGGSDHGESGYHPFSLGLCADTILGEQARGKNVGPDTLDMAPGDAGRLAQRFLKSLSDPALEVWVQRLALTPRFDEAAAREAFGSGAGAVQDAAWRALTGYSFIRATDAAGWWTLHSRMRDALANQRDAEEDHRFWREIWRARARSDADDVSALTWFHDYHLAPEAALEAWSALAGKLLQARRMPEHYALLGWWEPTHVTATATTAPVAGRSLVALGVECLRASLGNRSENVRRAVECFTRALHLYGEPDCLSEWAMAQHNLGIAYSSLPTGDRGDNLRQAIACYEAALRVRIEDRCPQEWAMTQNNLGVALAELPVGDRADNLRQAIACYEAALRVRTETALPQDWAATQNNLANAYRDLPAGDRGDNLRRAIACYEAALRVYTEAGSPRDWAMAQNNLGIAYWELPAGDRGANLRRAIACYQAALRVRTEMDFPQEWAATQNNLGIAYWNLPTGNRYDNLWQAIACYEAALRIHTEAEAPQSWAMLQNNLGAAYCNLPTGNRGDNLRRAIACYEAALRVRTEADFPQSWASTQNNLGNAYGDLPTGNRDDNLQRAIACYNAALRARTEADFPQDWAMTQSNLANAYGKLPTGDRGDNLRRAIACCEAALRVYTEADFPQSWAMTQSNLGIAYWRLPGGNRGDNLRRAIACHEAVLRVHTEADFPQDWAAAQNNLGNAYRDLPCDRGDNIQRAIAHYEAALRVRTEAGFPHSWAATQNNLGNAYRDLPTGDRGENLRRAITCYAGALRVRTETAFPQHWAGTQNNLGLAYANLPAGDRANNLRQAIACYKAALRVRTEAGLAQDWAHTQANLGDACVALGQIQCDPVNQACALACFDAAERGFRLAGLRRDADDAHRKAEAMRQEKAKDASAREGNVSRRIA